MRAVFVLALAAAVSAQERPTFRVATRLVQVSVVVQDGNGRPVTGLSARDFRLLDGGVAQRIELFAAESDPAPAMASEAPPANAAHGSAEFSNRTGIRGSATVILFDRLNTPAADQFFARQHLLTFLRQVGSEDRVGIYVLEGASIRVLHDFTSDPRSLVRAVARYDAASSREVDAVETPLPQPPSTGVAAADAAFQAALDSLTAQMNAHFNGIRSDATISAFQAIASRLASIDGRKSLIWITSGFPLDALVVRGLSRTTEIQRATRPLNDANVALYAVDARGLIGAFTVGPRGVPVMTTLSSVRTNLDVMQIAADETGGRAFYNTNDINRSVRRAIDDGRAAYTLGYYPSHATWDGRFRPITVQVGRPGVTVRHRKGYFAGITAREAESVRARAMEAAIQNPLEGTAIPLTARIERVPDTAAELRITLRADAASLTFERAGAEWTAAVNVAVAQTLAAGTMRKDVERRIDLRLRQDRYDAVRASGLSIDARATLHPDVQRLHIVVQDAATGSTGSLIIPRDRIPGLSGSGLGARGSDSRLVTESGPPAAGGRERGAPLRAQCRLS